MVAADFWSSTPYAVGSDSVWTVDFLEGSVHYRAKTIPTYVRAVRAGQCGGMPCPSMRILGEDNPKLENLRHFRDSTLAKSAVGHRIIQSYYSNADSINAALDSSPALRKVTRRVLEAVASMAGGKEE